MSLNTISRRTLELVAQSLRTDGVAPLGVPPGRGDAATAADPSYAVVDDLIRVLPFVAVDEGPFARQYILQAENGLSEPDATHRGTASNWTPGATAPFGQDLVPAGARFKKISLTVRIDEAMSGDQAEDMLDLQVGMAEVAVVRALSEAVLHSEPADDDDAALAGLPFFVTPGGDQEVMFEASRGMMGGLSELEARVAPGDDGFGAGPDCFVMSSRARWRLTREMEAKGLQPDYRISDLTGTRALHFHGLPVLTGRVAEPGGGPPLTDAWALTLTGPSAVRVMHLEGDDYGVRVDPVTTMAGLDANGEAVSATRGAEVYGLYSLLVPDPRSVARLRAVPAGDPFSQP